jgi:hypothetical protein
VAASTLPIAIRGSRWAAAAPATVSAATSSKNDRGGLSIGPYCGSSAPKLLLILPKITEPPDPTGPRLSWQNICTEVRLTLRWRKPDSNPRSPGYDGARFSWRRATDRNGYRERLLAVTDDRSVVPGEVGQHAVHVDEELHQGFAVAAIVNRPWLSEECAVFGGSKISTMSAEACWRTR